MQGERRIKASTPTGAVFLSYASQDADAARRICEALRAGDIEVWFDQSELRGGDTWDRKIRDQIQDCRLFIPVISANTEGRDEGYFRREWALAADRTRDMAHKKTFLVPVVIDGTSERGASVPEKFHELQWTRLARGDTPPQFVERIRQLLTADSSITTATAGQTSGRVAAPSLRRPLVTRIVMWGAAGIVVLASAYFVADRVSKRSTPPTASSSPQQSGSHVGPAVAFNPPPHSIAVLPFVNMSGDAAQEYFSDGVTEEILNSLARINELQVSARTSSFSFKGKDADIGTIARKLNVASVLEGSVRRSGHTIRVTAELDNAATEYHLWSQTYDRDLGDVLKLQTDIANAVANALKVTLPHDVAAKIELGGTHNPKAFDAYLRAARAYRGSLDEQGLRDAIALYSDAIHLDPDYATAYAERSIARFDLARNWATGASIRDYRDSAHADARKAISLSPDLADGHLALAILLEGTLEFTGANQEYQRAIALASGNAKLLRYFGMFAVQMGQIEAGLAAARRSVLLDPLNSHNHLALALSELSARQYDDALLALKQAKALAPDDAGIDAWLGYTYYRAGDFPSAGRACERADASNKPICLAMVYNKVGRHADAQTVLATYQADRGDSGAVFYAMIYAQWDETARALDWLETAMRHRDPYLEKLKTNGNFDPLRKEPRFQAIERALNFPD